MYDEKYKTTFRYPFQLPTTNVKLNLAVLIDLKISTYLEERLYFVGRHLPFDK